MQSSVKVIQLGVNMRCVHSLTLGILTLLFLGWKVGPSLGDSGSTSSPPPWESSFLIDMYSCSGTLIHPHWIITAAHCMDRYQSDAIKVEKLKSGDTVYHYAEEEAFYPVRITGYNGTSKDFWRKPIKINTKTKLGNNFQRKWRTASKVICHQSFKTEALSWKGNDFCLVELSKKMFYEPEGVVIPACLPSKGYSDIDYMDVYYTTGYGRRKINFCLTDMRGPEKFAVCGSPEDCRVRRRGAYCGLEFLYEGKSRNKCQYKTPNPSLKNPLCVELFRFIKSEQDGPHHVFNSNGKYNCSCYPKINGVGWCGTRDFGDSSVREPSYESGWGYCSDDKAYSQCDGKSLIFSEYNSNAFEVRLLDENICESKLEDNLKVEQPDVTRNDIRDILKKYSIFCSGRLSPGLHEKDAFFKRSKDGSFEAMEATPESLKQLYLTKKFKALYLNGGPNCFGDSGGPLWKYSAIAESGKVGPVLVGVFSFMLWGTCLGRQEPPFFGRVKDKLDWIYQFIPKNEICHGR